MKEILLNDGDCLPFVGMTQNLGRAEFSVCPIFKRGKLVSMFIYPLQQEDRSYYYKWEGHPKKQYTVQSYQSLDNPNIWMHQYCKEHKTPSFRMYVPTGANFLWFSVYSDSVSIGFLKTAINQP